jgi:hypothetical protein
MKKIVSAFFIGFIFLNAAAQITRLDRSNRTDNLFNKDSTTFNKEQKIELNGETKYTDFKIISAANDTTVVDTTLTLKKDYLFNYLRKDNFELLPFHNQGQTFNRLGYSFENNSLFPTIGINAKQFNYYKVEDMRYYYVPTPTSEIMYRTGLEQGQVLDAFITMNTSRQFNFSLAYKGLRSLGKYRNSLASHGNFRTTFNYHSKNKMYYLKGHFSSYDLLNNENGGLTELSLNNFESGDTNYIDRGRLDVNYTNAENILEGKRYYLNQVYTLYSKKYSIEKYNDTINKKIKNYKEVLKLISLLKKDSISDHNLKMIDSLSIIAKATKIDSSQLKSIEKSLLYDFKLGHSLLYETEHYRFKQSSANSIYGSAFENTIFDHTSYQKFNNQLYAQLIAPYLGSIKAKINYFNYNYHYNSILYYNSGTVQDKLKGNAIVFGADWNKKIANIYLDVNASSIIAGDITGSSLKASVTFKKDSLFNLRTFAEITSKTPNFNKLLYQSDYKNYNWQTNFKNEEIKNIGAEFKSEKWGSIYGSYNLVTNYTYFNENALPTQAGETLNYFKIKLSKALTFNKFTLENTIMYQKAVNGASFFNVPEFVTRNSFYYSNYLFKGKPLYLQTGFTFKYFTSFYAEAYNPVLSEFVLQNTTEIGNYPIFDFFVNGQIRRTRLFFKVENVGASFTGRNYYSAPSYPYRDLTVRFGLVWNFFI